MPTDDEDEPKKSFTLTEKELIESGGFLRELDQSAKLDRLNEKVETVEVDIARGATRFERIEKKLDTRMTNIAEKVSSNNQEFERTLAELKVDLTRLQAQVKVLLDLKESNWITGFLKLIEDRNIQAGLLLLGAWIANRLGPDVLKALLKMLGG